MSTYLIRWGGTRRIGGGLGSAKASHDEVPGELGAPGGQRVEQGIQAVLACAAAFFIFFFFSFQNGQTLAPSLVFLVADNRYVLAGPIGTQAEECWGGHGTIP